LKQEEVENGKKRTRLRKDRYTLVWEKKEEN